MRSARSASIAARRCGHTSACEQPDEEAEALPAMPLPEHVVADYQTVRLSLKGHPMQFLRSMFAREGVIPCREVNHANDKRRVRCAGVVLVRQRPGSAKGVVFMTLSAYRGRPGATYSRPNRRF